MQEKFISAVVARSTFSESLVIILKGVVNFLLNRILLSQVHARARKHTDTHKLACKSSLVRIRCPLSWENIWPHILFLRFAPPDHQLLTMFVYVFTHCSTLMNIPMFRWTFQTLRSPSNLPALFIRKIPWIWGRKLLTLKKIEWQTIWSVFLINRDCRNRKWRNGNLKKVSKRSNVV